MPIDISEWTLLAVIQNGIQQVQQNAATLIPAIFPQMPSPIQQQIITALTSGGLKSVSVQLAYLPNAQPQLPGVWLYQVPGGETRDLDVIGSTYTYDVSDSGLDTDQGIGSQKSWQVTVGSINVTDLLVLVGLVKWSLIGARASLGADPNRYIKQQLSWSGWSPMANSAGDVIFPYQQTLTFTITTIESAASTNTDLITGWTAATLTASD
ncbi:hypothetical protein [Sulfobacillus harzensis]|uniref:Uncharacterized protein n=1 Tax=Sulfobacillus harzensis TaxID=2729629 RepID=A0A7Y0L2P1_9FIRM|nr:hypothetical protein [Sulfobacillus harzensis]NMP20769.1 hypothetical protein [Sulfobacillus harzensis]